MTKAFVLVDIQKDYFPGGKMELPDIGRASENAGRLLRQCREKSILIFHIQNISTRPGAAAFLPGTAGAEIHPSVAPLPGENVIVKHYANSFRDTDLYERLKSGGIQELIICGAMSNMCIDATTRAAFDLGFTCTVVEDACAARDLQFNGVAVEAAKVHAAFMAALAYVYAKVVSIDQLSL
jgi:nicotinamidase-related amidase